MAAMVWLTRIFLGFTGLAFAGYGVVCLVSPDVVADAAQLGLASDVARAEVRAMYGGLQIAVGGLALAGLLRPALRPGALLALACVFAGLAGGRLVGLVVESAPGAYNGAAFAYEAVSAVLAVALWRRPAG